MPKQECDTCMEVLKVIPCPCEQCDWTMCRKCGDKWYSYKTRCPACRNENDSYRKLLKKEKSRKSCHLCVHVFMWYVICLMVVIILGRLFSMIIGECVHDFVCATRGAGYFMRVSLKGSVFVFIIFSLIVVIGGMSVLAYKQCIYGHV